MSVGLQVTDAIRLKIKDMQHNHKSVRTNRLKIRGKSKIAGTVLPVKSLYSLKSDTEKFTIYKYKNIQWKNFFLQKLEILSI